MSNRKISASAENFISTPPPLPLPAAGLGGEIKIHPEDFQVEELRPEPLSGDGEHWVATLRKRGVTTDWLARWLARSCGISPRGVGYAGLKDRQAVTVQDFSLHLPGRDTPPEWPDGLPEGVELVALGRDRRKIRPGYLAGNRFQVRLRGCRRDEAAAAAMMAWIAAHGVPNAFGEQRFGRGGENVAEALAALGGEAGGRGRGRLPPFKRGLYLSALRSELFNRVLAARVTAGVYDQLLAGDVAQLDGRSASFPVTDLAAELPRFQRGEIHPSGPLFGEGLLAPEGIPGELERAALAQLPEATALLLQLRVKAGRRALRVFPREFTLAWEEDALLLAFTLPAGSYATQVVALFQ